MPSRENSAHLVDVALVGAGISGTLMAIALLRRASIAIALIDDAPLTPALGVSSRLDVPVDKIISTAEASLSFGDWVTARGRGITESDFAPRALYREYLESVLRRASEGKTLERVRDRVVGIARDGNGFRLRFGSGHTLRARRVVLATGAPAPATPTAASLEFLHSDCYFGDPRAVPWEAIPRERRVLFLGSGIAMAEGVLALRRHGYLGKAFALSRHGRLPLPERAPLSPLRPANLPTDDLSVLSLLRRLRQETRAAESEGRDWREAFDAYRSHHPQWWSDLTEREQRRFLRHARTLWSVHRHRLPPTTADEIADLRAAGALSIQAGTLTSCELASEDSVRVTYRPRGGRRDRELHVAAVFNCTEPDLDLTTSLDPLYAELKEQGLVETTPGLGLVPLAPNLHTLGFPRTGRIFENTDVNELRAQADALAQSMSVSSDAFFF